MAKYQYIKTPLSGYLSDFGEPIGLQKVDETKWEAFWNELVREHHYLGYESVIGARIKYIITLKSQVIGAISFCSAAYKLGPRDTYIGWDAKTRQELLPHVITNNRFLILPWIQIRNLASHILSISLRRVRNDWEKQYKVTPYMVETFVDREKYQGTCYKAANWTYIGVTQGYGKQGKTFAFHGHKKDIYVQIMDRSFAKTFHPDIKRLQHEPTKKIKLDSAAINLKRAEELNEMTRGYVKWNTGLLEKVGIFAAVIKMLQTLEKHMARYLQYLTRKEHGGHFVAMLYGLLSSLERKTTEAIAVAFLEPNKARNLAFFMSDSLWDTNGMKIEYQADLAESISAPGGMITGDGSDFPKKGHHSVGVARQYCGNRGKKDSCQASVMAGYASSKGYGIVDYELYMPESWFDDDHAALRDACDVPKEITEHTSKNEMLLKMIQDIAASGKFDAKYVGIDSSFGQDHDFLDNLPQNLIYFADVHKNCYVFDCDAEAFLPEWSGMGRKNTREKTLSSPKTVEEVAANCEWSDVVLGNGTKGPIIAKDKLILVRESRKGVPGEMVWLYVRCLEDGNVKYSLCNESPDAPAVGIRKPATMRWSIEQCFEECKKFLGMDHYEARTWKAWHRHILLTLIAHLFIIKLRIDFSTNPDFPNVVPFVVNPVPLTDYLDACENLVQGLPIKNPDIVAIPSWELHSLSIGRIRKLIDAVLVRSGEVINEIDYGQAKDSAAYESHAKAKINKAFLAHHGYALFDESSSTATEEL